MSAVIRGPSFDGKPGGSETCGSGSGNNRGPAAFELAGETRSKLACANAQHRTRLRSSLMAGLYDDVDLVGACGLQR